jgi:CheY-like chemotaxis protein
LAIARRLVELHAGTISAASAGPSLGSEFVVYLALDDSPGEADAMASGAAATPSESAGESPRGTAVSIQRRIVIADDNAAIRVSLCALLQDLGHMVKAAADGEEALELAQAWLPDFVFLDISMPKLNGFEVARQLRARFPATAMRLVMMSGATLDEATLRGAARAGFDHCIDKIADPGVLADVLTGAAPPAADDKVF